MADDDSAQQDQYDEEERQSADDALEPADDMFHPTSDEEVLEEDNSPPASAPDVPNRLPPDHPQYDELDKTGVYYGGADDEAGDDDMEVDESGMMHPLEPEDEE